MIDIYAIEVSGGEWEDAYNIIITAFTTEEEAQKYIEMNCTLRGQDMQEKYGNASDYPHNYLWWQCNEDADQAWNITVITAHESVADMLKLNGTAISLSGTNEEKASQLLETFEEVSYQELLEQGEHRESNQSLHLWCEVFAYKGKIYQAMGSFSDQSYVEITCKGEDE